MHAAAGSADPHSAQTPRRSASKTTFNLLECKRLPHLLPQKLNYPHFLRRGSIFGLLLGQKYKEVADLGWAVSALFNNTSIIFAPFISSPDDLKPELVAEVQHEAAETWNCPEMRGGLPPRTNESCLLERSGSLNTSCIAATVSSFTTLSPSLRSAFGPRWIGAPRQPRQT